MNGSEIRQARERARLTQGELGEMVGVSGRTVGNWERGTSVPRNRAARLVEVLGIEDQDQDEPTNPLHVISDATLLAEIARRFEEGRTREKAGEGSADSSPSMNQAGGKPATEHHGPQPVPDTWRLAAYDTGTETEKQRLDREAAERDEGPQ